MRAVACEFAARGAIVACIRSIYGGPKMKSSAQLEILSYIADITINHTLQNEAKQTFKANRQFRFNAVHQICYILPDFVANKRISCNILHLQWRTVQKSRSRASNFDTIRRVARG